MKQNQTVLIDQCEADCSSNGRLDNPIRLCDECYNRTVMVGIGLAVQQDSAGDRLDSGDDLIQNVRPASFAEIWNAFYNFSHLTRAADREIRPGRHFADPHRNQKSYLITTEGAKQSAEERSDLWLPNWNDRHHGREH